ncbi:MAG TPA: 3-deoxy-D-manno-octulosonic acid transferase [Blastocatellia bacterium]|jgi:3-deoxy-D-manno-octulosonic-acid transferase|nr:3-deoxy-D-manno-octulosonic acid transferase [Blastocatellia bacterium]
MYLFYSLSLSLLFLALLPYFIYNAVRHGKYSGSFRERMGWLPESIRASAQPTIWIHTVSVGEFNAARPLIERLNREMPDHRLVISTTTLTGQRLARSAFEHVFFFPFDWTFTVRRALAHVSPVAVIILETELWPNFLRECRRRGVKTILANGRISPRSFARYMRVRLFIARALSDMTLLLMQGDDDARRVRALGADGRRVRTCGNLKYDIEVPPPGETGMPGRPGTRRLIVAGSTAPGEERIILEALRHVRARAGFEDVGLIIAPRHPERFEEVAGLLAETDFSYVRRSQLASPDRAGVRDAANSEFLIGSLDESKRGPADIVLLDTIGELAEVYRFADVVFVGGSLVPRGGHNIIEPSAFARPIIVGPYTENFRQIVSDFKEASAIVQLDEPGAAGLAREFIRLFSDPRLAREMGARARNILLENQGATTCAVAAIREIMGRAASENS